MTDITDRRAPSDQLGLAEERFRTIVEHTPAITYQESHARLYDGDRARYLRQPPGARGCSATRRRSGGVRLLAAADAPGRPRGRHAASDRATPRRARTLPPGLPGGRHATATVVWFHDEAVLIRDAEGEPLLLAGRDDRHHRRKDAEQQLAQAEERFRLLVERSPAIVYMELPSEGLGGGSVRLREPTDLHPCWVSRRRRGRSPAPGRR